MKPHFYLIHVVGLIEPVLVGRAPYFLTEEERDEAARDLHEGEQFDPEDDALFWADIGEDGHLRVGSYSAGFFEGGDSDADEMVSKV